MSPDKEKNVAVTTLAFLGLAGLLVLGAGNAVNTEASPNQGSSKDQTATTSHEGERPQPLPAGVTIPPEMGLDGEPLLKVESTWGDVYTVQKMDTGQYKIIDPKPRAFNIKFLREKDIKAFQ